jgi:hypothetical protein
MAGGVRMSVQLRPARRCGCFIGAVAGMAVCGWDQNWVTGECMTSPEKSRRVEVKDRGQTVAAAEMRTVEHRAGTVRTSLFPSSGHTPPGSRASLVDAVMGQPEVQASTRLEATVPLGDAESLQRLRERTKDTVTRPAGSTALVDADIPPASHGETRQEPGGQASAW